MKLKCHVFLIGMPGSGKSSLGKRVAGVRELPFVDTDQRVSDAVGCTIPQLFERYGEQAFRNAETNVLIQLTRETPSLVSTGGGTVLREENRSIMRNSGVIVLVDRPLQDILSDIKLDRRPLLARKGLPEVERLYHERIDIYRSAADDVLRNSNGYHAALWDLDDILQKYAI